MILIYCDYVSLSISCERQSQSFLRDKLLNNMRDELGRHANLATARLNKYLNTITEVDTHRLTSHQSSCSSSCIFSHSQYDECSACSPLFPETLDIYHGSSSRNGDIEDLDLSTNSLCPWRYHVNVNPDRYPTVLLEAVRKSGKIKCSNTPGGRYGVCEPVTHLVPVLLPSQNDNDHGKCKYEHKVQSLAIGFICSTPTVV